jgi:magnesium transporter
MTARAEQLRKRLSTSDDRAAASLLAAAHSDDAADVLAGLPEARRSALMRALPDRQRRRIAVLTGEEPAIASSLMNTDFLAFYGDATVAHALDRIRTCGLDAQSTAVVFIANRDRHLFGTITFKALLAARPDEQLHHVMRLDPEKLRADATFEEIARVITDYDLLAAPVVDDERHILGIITPDDVLEVIMPKRWRRSFRPDPGQPL